MCQWQSQRDGVLAAREQVSFSLDSRPLCLHSPPTNAQAFSQRRRTSTHICFQMLRSAAAAVAVFRALRRLDCGQVRQLLYTTHAAVGRRRLQTDVFTLCAVRRLVSRALQVGDHGSSRVRAAAAGRTHHQRRCAVHQAPPHLLRLFSGDSTHKLSARARASKTSHIRVALCS